MTAVVGVLNKQAIAVAADSAVTIGTGSDRKILNHANKIFRLSHTQPVGIIIYNASDFMQTPWEVIIKVYRDQLGIKTFPKLEDYQKDFLTFLKEKDYYASDQDKEKSILTFCYLVFERLRQQAFQPFQQNRAHLQISQLVDALQNRIQLVHNYLINNPLPYCEELEIYELSTFEQAFSSLFNAAVDNAFLKTGFTLSQETIGYLKRIVYEFLKSREFLNHFTGLIFMGYGETELFPSLIPLNISFVVEQEQKHYLRYFVNELERRHITTDLSSAICPFAQTDVIETILKGIDPSLSQIHIHNFENVLKKYNQLLTQFISPQYPKIVDLVAHLDIQLFVSEYARANQKVQQELYIAPLIRAIGMLSKEDLAEMAESLIYLTYLKRRITFAAESVGGPVDVAIISKSDGFIWVKRKQYIKPEINHHYFSNYLKS